MHKKVTLEFKKKNTHSQANPSLHKIINSSHMISS